MVRLGVGGRRRASRRSLRGRSAAGAPTDVGDAALGHQPTDVALAHGEVLDHAGDVEKPGKTAPAGAVGVWHGLPPLLSLVPMRIEEAVYDTRLGIFLTGIARGGRIGPPTCRTGRAGGETRQNFFTAAREIFLRPLLVADSPAGRKLTVVNSAGEQGSHELVVAEDGSIPADQLARLGLRPGTHLRVVKTGPVEPGTALAGSLPDFPELDWEDFERGSELARRDLTST
jgi:hypothetical protein